MSYHYLAFGIPFISEIELSALMPLPVDSPMENPVYVRLGTVPTQLSGEVVKADFFTDCTIDELLYHIPKIMKLYIANGNEVIVEPIDPEYTDHLIYFYSTCLTAILYQRDQVPFHVSGVFTAPGKVALFAAESGTGKSTLAVKLQELGYLPFTDDTAVIYVENGKCYALASYPMMRLWEKSIAEQTLLKEDEKQKIYADEGKMKYGFAFHEQFATEPAEVEQIIYLKKEGTEIQVKPIKNIEAFKALADNVFRQHWVPALEKGRLHFNLISRIVQLVPGTCITRPAEKPTYNQFPSIVKNILGNKDK